MFRSSYYVLEFLAIAAVTVSLGESDVLKECRPVIDLNSDEMCCDLPDDVINEQEEKYIKECEELWKKDTSSTSDAKKSPDESSSEEDDEECINECIYNKTGLLTNEKKLNEEAIRKDYMKYFGEGLWKPLAEEALKKCFEEAPKFATKDSKCNSGALQMYICTSKELYLNCPSDKWKDSEVCKTEKAQIEKCNAYKIQ